MLVATDVNGKVVKSKALDVEMINPELWWVDEAKEEAVITYTPVSDIENNIDREDLEDIAVAQLTGPEGNNKEEEDDEGEEEGEESEQDEQEDVKDLEDTTIAQPSDLKKDYEVIRIGFDGKVKASGKLSAPFAMNRFVEHSNFEDVYIGKCNFSEAPKGNFEVIPYKMP